MTVVPKLCFGLVGAVHIPAESLQFIDGFGSGGWSAGC